MTSEIKFTAIPDGAATCTVSPLVNVILSLPESIVLDPSPTPTAVARVPSFVFYITHKPTGKTLLYDLGVRYDWQQAYTGRLKESAEHLFKTKIIDDVGKILEKGKADPASVHGIIFSHEHWDHTGYIAPFTNAELIGGANTFSADLKDQIDAAGRQPRVINFDTLPGGVGAFDKAFDYFGDGSLWVCSAPGHTKDHVSVLVRVTGSPSATYLLLGSDTAHHPCILCSVPGHDHFRLKPTFRVPGTPDTTPEVQMHFNADMAKETIKRTKLMEQQANVMSVMGHDFNYWRVWENNKDVMFPGTDLTHWKAKGLKLGREYDATAYD